jgi:hypothetical protein
MQYTYSQVKSDLNARIKGKIGILIDSRSTINQGVRQTISDIDLLTSRRKARLTPNLFTGIYEYAAPTDLKGYGIITIQNQTFEKSRYWNLVPYEQFLRRQDQNTIAVSDHDGLRKILLKTVVQDEKITIGNFNSTIGWTAFGDAENIDEDKTDFITRNASLSFDISNVGGTTAGVENSAIGLFDITEYLKGNGTVTVWVKITSTTGLTNYIMRVGSDSSNYYQVTTTTQSDGTAFVTGWNLLKFDLTSLTETGTVVDTACVYSALYMTKAGTKVSETGYKFDDMVLHRGEISNIYYYSGYGWQTSTGTYIRNSTADSDYLNAGEEEYELMLCKCTELAADEVDEDKVSDKQQTMYEKLKKTYELTNPSESLVMTSTTVDFVKL